MISRDAYIICTTPRSGSTLLCDLLTRTGIAGRPESYFHQPSVSAWRSALKLPAGKEANDRASLKAVFNAVTAAGSDKSGMFGLRMQGDSLDFFARQLAILYPDHSNDRDRLCAAFGQIAFIHLTRLDKVAQAISLVKANQTGLWHRRADGSELQRTSAHQDPVYNAAEISARLRYTQALDQRWRQWFSVQAVTPYQLTYESLAADPKSCLMDLLDHLGLNTEAAIHVTPGVAKLADSSSREWALRYRAEHTGVA